MTYESGTLNIEAEKLESIFRPQQDLSDSNIQSIALMLEKMIQNITPLFDAINEVEEPSKLKRPVIENPPNYIVMPLPSEYQT